MDPKILILDDALSAVDAKLKRKLYKTFKNIDKVKQPLLRHIDYLVLNMLIKLL